MKYLLVLIVLLVGCTKEVPDHIPKNTSHEEIEVIILMWIEELGGNCVEVSPHNYDCDEIELPESAVEGHNTPPRLRDRDIAI